MQLDETRRSIGAARGSQDAGRRADRCLNTSELRIVRAACVTGVLEIGVVEEVEELCTEFQLGVAHVGDGQTERLEGAEVHVRVRRSDQAVTALTSSKAGRRSKRVDKVARRVQDTGHHVHNMR